ncbi:hypothetical protein KCP73_14255 [Salmonella enterica subsp. enterica]|nr:hypothetical protein KCP73_14255 [Salmonella enterica subsp. enterica]
MADRAQVRQSRSRAPAAPGGAPAGKRRQQVIRAGRSARCHIRRRTPAVSRNGNAGRVAVDSRRCTRLSRSGATRRSAADVAGLIAAASAIIRSPLRWRAYLPAAALLNERYGSGEDYGVRWITNRGLINRAVSGHWRVCVS